MSAPSTADRFRGALLGLATGDALGTAVEFRPAGTFAPVADLTGGGPHGLPAGAWTDDTSMALCLAESLLARGGSDPADQLARYVRWWREGHNSSTGACFDIGVTIEGALERFERTGEAACGPTDPQMAGNGAIMRLAPVAMRYAGDARAAIEAAVASARTTHQAPAVLDAVRYMTGLLVGALRGEPKETLLSPAWTPVPGLFDREPLGAEIAEVAGGSFKRRNPPEVRATGYVVDCLEAALWAINGTDDWTEGALAAVNLGNDADTVGAVYGQLAGALYGAEAIPAGWRAKLVQRERIEAIADQLREAGHVPA